MYVQWSGLTTAHRFLRQEHIMTSNTNLETETDDKKRYTDEIAQMTAIYNLHKAIWDDPNDQNAWWALNWITERHPEQIETGFDPESIAQARNALQMEVMAEVRLAEWREAQEALLRAEHFAILSAILKLSDQYEEARQGWTEMAFNEWLAAKLNLDITVLQDMLGLAQVVMNGLDTSTDNRLKRQKRESP
jgi:hypothetical protein